MEEAKRNAQTETSTQDSTKMASHTATASINGFPEIYTRGSLWRDRGKDRDL